MPHTKESLENRIRAAFPDTSMIQTLHQKGWQPASFFAPSCSRHDKSKSMTASSDSSIPPCFNQCVECYFDHISSNQHPGPLDAATDSKAMWLNPTILSQHHPPNQPETSGPDLFLAHTLLLDGRTCVGCRMTAKQMWEESTNPGEVSYLFLGDLKEFDIMCLKAECFDRWQEKKEASEVEVKVKVKVEPDVGKGLGEDVLSAWTNLGMLE